MIFPFKFLPPFNFLHPLIALNNNDLFVMLDPLSFKVKLSEDSVKEVNLEKEILFETEKASFIEMNEEFLFILTSQSALCIAENENNNLL
jgi:hypothetical protein